MLSIVWVDKHIVGWVRRQLSSWFVEHEVF